MVWLICRINHRLFRQKYSRLGCRSATDQSSFLHLARSAITFRSSTAQDRLPGWWSRWLCSVEELQSGSSWSNWESRRSWHLHLWRHLAKWKRCSCDPHRLRNVWQLPGFCFVFSFLKPKMFIETLTSFHSKNKKKIHPFGTHHKIFK